ncbi:IS607 family transposase [Nodularia spumigena]|uniref:IS607 family transposase n=1 Tax=Nodularia spumigena TaxID=70799 RepID=UPI0000EA950F|nr:IS607 family transposase [Nodularia spumigena]AHJ29577.1 Transposase [Nodularia spumigena CCY9414]AHJ29791.1 Transposase, IS605 OrfB [Nodularia spumigena CCY9414]EAW42704.1 transposase OrfB [Nodularia spumigena CCY9414]EAW43226.1 transposase OrfB [Nodularia spumigena CCY9414]
MFKPHEFAEKIGVSVKTLQRWDNSGKLPAKRTPSGHRFYTENDLLIIQGLKPTEQHRKNIVYCRVSSNGQKPELRNQITAMETFCLNRGLAVDEWVSEIGGGLNFKRKKFLSIMMSMLQGEIAIIVIAHKDRMCRFAYEGLPHTTCKSITISRTADSWFIAFAYEQEHEPTLKKYEVVGVDIGVKELATLSTGVVFPNPKHYKTNLRKLKRLSRKLARKIKGSNNRYKAKITLARHHAKIANLRKNTLHKITTYLCKNHAKIVVENLNVSGMLSNHKLAQVIADCGFYEFKRQLEYKAKKFGCEIIIADRWFPSTKTCSNCGHIQDMPLSERVYNCQNCGHSMDRDLNAAIVLSRLAKP